MKIPVHIAEKLLQMSQGEIIPSSKVKHALIDELVSEGIIERNGRIQKTLQISNIQSLFQYLHSKFGVSDLNKYLEINQKENIQRSELVQVSSDSKLKQVRTFKGFLVNCYCPIEAELNGKQITLNPVEGIFQFIYDFERFIPSSNITIVGIENPENFRFVERQRNLFNNINPLFVSRYPQNQNKDFIKWIQSIPNNYLHFGDFDFAGIGIYINEYKRHLADKASFFIPHNIERLINDFGNKKRYDNQIINFDSKLIQEENLSQLIDTIHKNRRGLDQEILIKNLFI